MLAAGVLTGLACGVLLARVAFALWGAFRRMVGLSHAVNVLGWLAGALLLAGAFSAWGDPHLSVYASHLVLMAAVAALPGLGRSHEEDTVGNRPQPLPWGAVLPILPALPLTVAGLFWIASPTQPAAGSPPAALLELALVVCGGLGARTLGQGLRESSTIRTGPERRVPWTYAAAYTGLILLTGSTALVNLWQLGSVGSGTACESALAGIWLAWSAAWVSPRRPPWVRALLIYVAALSLVIVAAGYSAPGA